MKTFDEHDLHCRTSSHCFDQPAFIEDCTCTCDDCTQANLTEIANWWGEILEDRFPGTRRRWHQRRDTVEKAAEKADRDHEERLARFGANSNLPRHLRPRVVAPPGASPSPARDDVLDTVAKVTWKVIDLRNEVAARFNAGERQIGVSEACRWIAETMPSITEPAFRRKVAKAALDIVRDVRAATGQVEDVIQLDAECIICGQETLLAYAPRMRVTCVSDECVCDLHDCGCHAGFKHSWTEDQLVWLARVLRAEDVEAS